MSSGEMQSKSQPFAFKASTRVLIDLPLYSREAFSYPSVTTVTSTESLLRFFAVILIARIPLHHREEMILLRGKLCDLVNLESIIYSSHFFGIEHNERHEMLLILMLFLAFRIVWIVSFTAPTACLSMLCMEPLSSSMIRLNTLWFI